MEKFDLHMHTNLSDGTTPPVELVRRAAALGVPLIALTDHDIVMGVPEAQTEGERVGVRVLGGVEVDADYELEGELHILGINIDIQNAALTDMLSRVSSERERRNEAILDSLSAAGMEVRPFMRYSEGNTTRLHLAFALLEGGFVASINDAFNQVFAAGGPGYVAYTRPAQRDVIRVIHQAGGLAVLAHPHKIKTDDIGALVRRLCGYGLDGLETYYPAVSEDTFTRFCALARQNNLLMSCGSDFHGSNRKSVEIGCTWQDTEALKEIYTYLC